jgi:arylsulfatase
LPLDASALTRFILPRPSIVAGRDELTYTKPIVGVPLGTAPSVLNKSFTITADIEVPQGGGNGMLVTQGGRFGGWGFTLLKGKPVFVYDLLDLERPRVEGSAALTPGKHKVEFAFKSDGPGLGRAGPPPSPSTAPRRGAARFRTPSPSHSRPAKPSMWGRIRAPG